MNEDLLQFVWKNKYLLSQNLVTTHGQNLQIIKTGLLNKESGPDFFNAQVKLGDTLWVGNIEIHIKSSDWIRHKHHHDKAYENVILHVVWICDLDIKSTTGEIIPTLEIKDLISPEMLSKYEQIFAGSYDIPCTSIFKPISTIEWTFWLDRLAIERLESKLNKLYQMLSTLNGNWEALLFHQIAQAFGQKINAIPFELLSLELSPNILVKYKDDLISHQALVLGTAGFLDKKLNNEYNKSLQSCYHYLKQKHGLQTLDYSIWKFGKTRPANFPTLRLFQLAEWMRNDPLPLSNYIHCKTVKDLKRKLVKKGSQKVDIGELHPRRNYDYADTISISEDFVDSIIINAIIPVLFGYGKQQQLDWLCERVQGWASEISAEKNHIIQQWKKLGVSCVNAQESQALIQLKNYYCTNKLCLQCAVGNFLLKPKKELAS
ncbi:MAG: DUF2851 family protein [bacterium]|nr:DUF2851 family protein [bacterium]